MAKGRREFLGGLMGLFGLGGVAQSCEEEQKTPQLKCGGQFTDEKFKRKCQTKAEEIWNELTWSWDSFYCGKVTPPNTDESKEVFIGKMADQLYWTGTVYVWKVRNIAGHVSELHVLPTKDVIMRVDRENLSLVFDVRCNDDSLNRFVRIDGREVCMYRIWNDSPREMKCLKVS